MKWVQLSPSAAAFSFISEMKRVCVPATWSASAIAASLPEGSSRP